MRARRVLMAVAAAAFLLGGGIQAAFAEDYNRPGPYLSAGFSWGKEAINVENIEDKVTKARRAEQLEATPTQCGLNQFDCNKSTLVDRQDSPGADVRFGYRFNDIFAAELNYQYFDDYKLILRGTNLRTVQAGQFVNVRGKDQDIAHITAHNVFANVRAYPWTGILQPYGLLGIGGVVADAKTKEAKVRTATDDDGFDVPDFNAGSDLDVAFAGRIGGGLDYYLTRNIVLNLDISWILTTGLSIDGIPANFQLNQVPITTSVMYRF